MISENLTMPAKYESAKDDMLQTMYTAMDNAREGITISDAALPGNPLIYVNEGFLKMSGYTREEIIGTNCRFLQGRDTNRATVKMLGNAIANREAIQVDLLNYHKNGKAFWNTLSLTPVFDEYNMLINFIGVQDDITVKKEKEAIELKIARQQLINSTTLLVQEKQRKDIGEELHDNINQMLATTRLYLTMAMENKDQQDELIEQSRQFVDKTIEEIRKLSKSLVAPKLYEVSLNSSLCDLVEEIELVVPFKIYYTSHLLNEDALDEEKKLMLFRITQEQLNNCIKHSHANNISINLEQRNNSVILSIKDDGVGFNPSEKAEGIGLKNIRSRIEFQNGTMHLETSPGNGCLMIIYLPCD